MSQQDILRFEEAGKIVRVFKRYGLKDTEIDANGDGDVLVLLDLRPDDSFMKQIVNRVQKLRKKSGLEPTDFVEVYIESLDVSVLQQVLSSQDQYIKDTIGSSLLPSTLMPSHALILSYESFQNVSKLSFKISLVKFNKGALSSVTTCVEREQLLRTQSPMSHRPNNYNLRITQLKTIVIYKL
ncbi:hypothetical protein Bca4012_075342 [Brassica carinata]|uniref:Uncharacterized protein n=1 Tax=Brassica carinata TaxID=52824 RepID=A0A8X7QGR4_BRACI|nr:hypothetical protein Bca52824_074253 [Brassica carinata]